MILDLLVHCWSCDADFPASEAEARRQAATYQNRNYCKFCEETRS